MYDVSAKLDVQHGPNSLEGPASYDFRDVYEHLFFKFLRDTQPVEVGEWQSQKIDTLMREILHVVFEVPMPEDRRGAEVQTGARLPWAEDHFQERVSGKPLNPAPSEAWWPFASKKEGTNVAHKSEGEAFSHTYPERMWPKRANIGNSSHLPGGSGILGHQALDHLGIRFAYGDLDDVVTQLSNSQFTRQAYLPIWFPEDTGAVHGKRVPCTLGYHFIIRDGRLDISYFMRSTDLLRHFQDDVYMAMRLAQWVVDELREERPNTPLRVGKLIFHTANLHIFEPDIARMQYWTDTTGQMGF